MTSVNVGWYRIINSTREGLCQKDRTGDAFRPVFVCLLLLETANVSADLSGQAAKMFGAQVKRCARARKIDLDLAYDTLDLAGEPGVAMTIYTAEPGSPTQQALNLLASWAASQPADHPGSEHEASAASAEPQPRLPRLE